MNTTTLFYTPTPRPEALLRLFCFSFAGGSSTTYLPWINHLPRDVELVVCQLPGRGTRLFETPYDVMAPMAKDLCREMHKFTDKPFVFFGHSMGAKVAYELAVTMDKQGFMLPAHFIASAASAPFLKRRADPIHHLPHDEFVSAIAKLNGTPAQVLDNPELLELFLPAVRADFKIIESYCNLSYHRLDTRLTLFGGVMDESVVPSELSAWEQVFTQTSAECWFQGEHFFINQKMPKVLQALNKILISEIYEYCELAS